MDRSLESVLARRLGAIEADGALRLPVDDPPAGDGRHLLDVTSNDYLGLGHQGVSRETLRQLGFAPPGARASRLISGTHSVHLTLERELAHWVDLPAALLFSTGYAANVGTLAALGRHGDVIFSDALNHASIIDGCRLSNARVEIYRHLDLADLAARLRNATSAAHRWVVTESYFSMDADTPDLAALCGLCRTHAASLIVDEAHALGVFGPEGGGLLRQAQIRPDVLVGTLGKAVGAQGAFVAGSPALRNYLWNRARSFVFSTAPSPLLAALTTAQLRRARAADDRRNRLHAAAVRLRRALEAAGVPLPTSHGPILPLLLGTNAAALQATRALAQLGIRASAIRPPTVPPGTARLRIALHATLTNAQLDLLAEALATLEPCPAS